MSNKLRSIFPFLALLFVKLAVLLFAVIRREDNAPVMWGELKIVLLIEIIVLGAIITRLWFFNYSLYGGILPIYV